MRVHHFHPPMFVSKPDPKWQGGEDERRRLAVKWWGFFFFFFLHCYHPLAPPSLSSPFKSVTHYMSGQRMCARVRVCVRARRRVCVWGGGGLLESNSLRLSVSDLNLTGGSQKQLREREWGRERMRGRDEVEGCTKESGGRREEGTSGEHGGRESWGELCVCVCVRRRDLTALQKKIWEIGWNKFKHKHVVRCPWHAPLAVPSSQTVTYELAEWIPHLLSATCQHEGHYFFYHYNVRGCPETCNWSEDWVMYWMYWRLLREESVNLRVSI